MNMHHIHLNNESEKSTFLNALEVFASHIVPILEIEKLHKNWNSTTDFYLSLKVSVKYDNCTYPMEYINIYDIIDDYVTNNTGFTSAYYFRTDAHKNQITKINSIFIQRINKYINDYMKSYEYKNKLHEASYIRFLLA